MRRVSIFGVFIALVGLLLSSTVTVAHPEQPEHVIIVTIDGARPDKLAEADTPNIDDVAASGAVALTCTSVFPAKTPSAHASLFTGARPELHGFYAPGDELRAETIFQVFEEAGYKTALIDGKGGRIAGLEGNVTHVKMDVDYRWLPGENEWEEGSEDTEGDLRVMENAIRIFVDNRPRLMFILLPQVDTAGHLYSHQSDEYLRAFERADRAIGMLVDNLTELGIYENTLLVITSDHGMTGKDHGDDPGDLPIPLIMRGPGVVVKSMLEDAEIIDVAPTISRLAGVRTPENSEGENLQMLSQENLRQRVSEMIARAREVVTPETQGLLGRAEREFNGGFYLTAYHLAKQVCELAPPREPDLLPYVGAATLVVVVCGVYIVRKKRARKVAPPPPMSAPTPPEKRPPAPPESKPPEEKPPEEKPPVSPEEKSV